MPKSQEVTSGDPGSQETQQIPLELVSIRFKCFEHIQHMYQAQNKSMDFLLKEAEKLFTFTYTIGYGNMMDAGKPEQGE